MKLGHRVDKIRTSKHFVKHHPERRAELDALGFVWDDLERRWEEVHAALLAYQEVHGDLEPPGEGEPPRPRHQKCRLRFIPA